MPLRRTGHLGAVLSLVFGSTLWGLYWLPLRLIEDTGLPALWAIAFVYLGASVVLGGLARAEFKAIRGAGERIRLFGISVSAALSGTAFSLGVLEGEVARVLLFFYLSPLWSVVLAHWFLHEPMTVRTLTALALALVGAFSMLVLDSGGAPSHPAWGSFGGADLLGLMAGFGFALTNLQLRAAARLPARLKNLAAVILVPAVASSAGLAIDLPFQLPSMALLGSLLVGAIWMSSMVAAVQIGVSALPLQQSSVLLLTELVVGTLSAALIAGEHLSPGDLIGGLAIVAAGLLAGLEPRTAATACVCTAASRNRSINTAPVDIQNDKDPP